jgi:hypothetical protein
MLAVMFGRILAFALALSVGGSGVLPTGDGARCLIMDKRVSTGEDCCPKCDPPPVTAIGTPCCEVIHGRVLDVRAQRSVAQLRIPPAPLTAVLPPPPRSPIAGTIALRSVSAQPRGRPPGEQLDRFSAILRI